MDKPTLKEYLNSHNARYVRTSDGLYYKVKRKWIGIVITILTICVFIVPMIILFLSEVPWKSGMIWDILILEWLFIPVMPLIMHPFDRFILLTEGSEDYQKAIGKSYSPYSRLNAYILTAVIVLFYSIFSFSFAYMRSLMDTPVVECRMHMEEADKSITLESNKDDPVITLRHDPEGEIDISLWITHTPYVPQLTLDGEVIVPYDQYQSSYFWFSKDYFWQREYYTVNTEDIRDGSVLSVSCGEWRYSWVFLVNGP